jgi:hypothetical protein
LNSPFRLASKEDTLTTPTPPDGESELPEPATAAVDDSVGDASAAEPTPAPRRKLGRILGLSIGGFVVLVIAALGITYAILSANYAPSAAVDHFLSLVVKGQSSEAVATLNPAPLDDDALVDDDLYAEAKHRISSYKIESTKVTKNEAVVEVKLKTDAGSWTQRFNLVTSQRVLLFDVWTVDGNSLSKIRLDDDRPSEVTVTANGVQIQRAGELTTTFFALPGDYRFAIVSDSSLVKADSHAVQVTSFGQKKTVALQVQLTADGVSSARTAVDAFLDACVSQTVLSPTGNCGYEVTDNPNYPNETLSNIQWSIKQRPVVSFDSWQDDGWTVKTDTAGALEMEADFRDGREYGTAVALFGSYDIQGYIQLKDGALVFVSTYEGDAGNEPNA